MLKEGKVYIPKDEALRVEIIRLYHDIPMGGHMLMTNHKQWWCQDRRNLGR